MGASVGGGGVNIPVGGLVASGDNVGDCVFGCLLLLGRVNPMVGVFVADGELCEGLGLLGSRVGRGEITVGVSVGLRVGIVVGYGVGLELGRLEGTNDGELVGTLVGCCEGSSVGSLLGRDVSNDGAGAF